MLLLYRAASEGPLKGIIGYVEEDLVSTDFVGDSRYAFALYHLGADIADFYGTVMSNSDGVLCSSVGLCNLHIHLSFCCFYLGRASSMPRLVSP